MSNVPASVTMDNLIDRLWNRIVGEPRSGKTSAVNSPQVTSIQMCYPGIPILGADLENMRSDFNPQGDLRATEAFSKWVDRIPDVTLPTFKPHGTVTDAYGTVLGGANSDSPAPSLKEREAYKKAHQFLYAKAVNPFTNEKAEFETETEVYKTYKQRRKAYDDALGDYVARWAQLDLNNLTDQKTWQAEGRALQRAIDAAWNDWEASNKNYVEMALGLLGSQLKDMTNEAISSASALFAQSTVSSLSGGPPFHPAYTFPNGWWKEGAQGWTELDVKSDYSYLSAESHTKKAGGKASFLGLFSIGGSGGVSEGRYAEEQESTNIEIRMKVAVVDILRPWLRTAWMKSSNWFLRGEPPGRVSSGSVVEQSNSMLLPLIPMQLIVARDIKLTGNWSNSTREKVTQSLDHGISFGYGPFSIGGSYSQTDVSQKQQSRFEGNTLHVDGMQVIGFVSTCPPLGAPKSGVK